VTQANALAGRTIAERYTVENMTHEVVDFYISEVGAGVS